MYAALWDCRTERDINLQKLTQADGMQTIRTLPKWVGSSAVTRMNPRESELLCRISRPDKPYRSNGRYPCKGAYPEEPEQSGSL
jgi:hypothetical protein